MGEGVGSLKSAEQKAEGIREYFSVPVSLYQAGDLIDRDLFLFYQGQYLLFRPRNLVWASSDTERLKDFGVSELFIHCRQKEEHYEFLESNIRKVLESNQIDAKRKSKIMFETSQTMMRDVFENHQSPATVKRSVSMVKNSIDFLKDKENFIQLMTMASADFSEYTHAVQVSAYSISLAKQIGMKSFNELSAIGIGALLHDIGKVKVDRRILDKKTYLNADERDEVRKHPQYGYEILKPQKSVPEMAEQIVLQHHERPNGSGYPQNLSEDMLIGAKIVAISDCFDCLTSNRPWQPALKSIEAIQVMLEDCRDEYDLNLMTDFIRILGIKP